jgi:hypothetical protein
VDITQGELVEAENDAFIRRRDKQRRETEGERLGEELYKESCRQYVMKRDRERAAEWVEYLEGSATGVLRNAFAIARKKRREAKKLRERYELERLKETA